ncbi:MAG: [FeFe] hydrogenase H-cluster maturation GTPase HydF [Anaerobutyricum sp.]|nr:[FeFe] hydrogenase H-cluster maturation GTPase HydF [Anaerobutyricum sp.]
MGLNDTPSGERVHIGFFGRRNAGKSSVVNAVTGQELAVVSDTKGTTTDPVKKAMELLPIGPVMIIDTPGFDDVGALGEQRVKKTKQILNRTDVAVLVIDAVEGMQQCDRELQNIFEEKQIPYLLVYNKMDLLEQILEEKQREIYVSALKKERIEELKERIAAIGKVSDGKLQLVGDLIHPSDLVLLVIPIDKAAPKGRLILPQQQVIRDVLEADGAAICVKEYELRELLDKLGTTPALVITDSQVFAKVSADVPEEIPLTSFSILMARYKGLLDTAVEGVTAIDSLKDGDRILIAEGCTHHRQCDDIGSVKIPRWLRNYTGKELEIETCSGQSFPEDLSPYTLVIHCGGCMLNEREVRYRMKCAKDQQVPITNYGIAIAFMQGILKRSVQMFPHLSVLFQDED